MGAPEPQLGGIVNLVDGLVTTVEDLVPELGVVPVLG
jgi:hypothetical protein